MADAADLARLALEVLKAQAVYFKSRSTADLAASKALEARLKRAAEDALAGPSLFDEGEARTEPAGVRFALGHFDGHSPKAWFIRSGAFLGNLLRTQDPSSAWTWDSAAEAGRWMESLPEASRDQLRDRALLVFPIRYAVGNPVTTLTLTRVDDPDVPIPDGVPRQKELLTETKA